MLNFISKFIINSLALIMTSLLVPGFDLDSPRTALIAAVVLGLANTLVKPVIRLLTLPLQIVTLGLFTLVINASILTLAAQIVSGFTIQGFTSALLGALILSVISSLLTILFH